MDADWPCSAAYVYVLHLEPGSRAWEYLRRNPRYVRDWMRHRRSASHAVAARWGLASLVDPRLDGRAASPIWTSSAAPPVALVRDRMRRLKARTASADLFCLWRLAGRKRLFHDGSGLRLTVHFLTREVQMRMSDDLGDGDRFAYQVPATADDRGVSAALRAFRSLNGPELTLERPSRADLFHVRALQVLDGLSAGASQRELGIAIFGRAAVDRGWQPDGALRAQVRYLIRRARALVAGEYRSLIASGPAGSRFPRRTGRGRSRGEATIATVWSAI